MPFESAVPIFLGRLISWISRTFNLGAGATWPGEIALRLDPNILSKLAKHFRKGIVMVAGTNGKTTTTLMIKTILEAQGLRVVHNASGANLLNGIVSACIQQTSWNGKLHVDYGVFEVDENSLPLVLQQISHSRARLRRQERGNPEYDKTGSTGSPIRSGMTKRVIIVLLNLFRDQLDRYGELDVIAEKWEKALKSLESRDHSKTRSHDTTLIMNADDPLVAHIGITSKLPVTYFGVNDKTKYLSKMEHATDSIFCLNCGSRLTYEGIYFSHIGIWRCIKCKEKRPTPDISKWKSPLPGLYNQYNTLAAVSVAKELNIKENDVEASLADFQPAFGRQEKFVINGKRVKIFLSKNPAGFNQSLKTVLELGATQLLFVLNDRIPDGRDVSWIWDVDFEMITEPRGSELNRGTKRITVSGDRAYDMALRMKYAGLNCEVYKNWAEAIKKSLENIKSDETLYILPTYSAMLEVRKILKGRKVS